MKLRHFCGRPWLLLLRTVSQLQSRVTGTATGNSRGARAGGNGDGNCPMVAQPAVVSTTSTVICQSSIATSKWATYICSVQSTSRASQKPKLETLLLPNIWQDKLTDMGWSQRAQIQLLSEWARATLTLYDRVIAEFYRYCVLSWCFVPSNGFSYFGGLFTCTGRLFAPPRIPAELCCGCTISFA